MNRSRLENNAWRPTRAEVDLDALAFNLAQLSAAVSVPILAVVKADAYGHGLLRVALRLQAAGAFGFGVALAEEGFALREAGIRKPILVMNGIYAGAYQEVIDAALTPVVYREADIEGFDAAAAQTDGPVGIHLKIDTGMSRLGVRHDALSPFLDQLDRHPRVQLRGVMTHFAAAELDPEFSALQVARLERALAQLRRRGHTEFKVHACNTGGALHVPAARYDFVRSGIGLYGHLPVRQEESDLAVDLRAAMRWRTEIVDLHALEAGESVGYDRTFIAEGPRKIATIGVGYGDGYSTGHSSAAGKGEVLIRGVRCPIAGRVAMDLCCVDVSALPEVQLGDEVLLMGNHRDGALLAHELAHTTGTHPYEIWCRISRRVPRFYSTSFVI